LSSAGKFIAAKTINTITYINDFGIDRADNIYLSGEKDQGEIPGTSNYYLKLDKSGRTLVSKLGAGDNSSPKLLVDTSANIFMNYTSGFGKYTGDGTLIWKANIDQHFRPAFALDKYNYLYTVAKTSSLNFKKHNSNGQIVWQRTIPQITGAIKILMTVDEQNNVIICSSYNMETRIIKYPACQ
ncbi:MAG: hypothetical protein ABIN95_01645, partial [Mucilaginibacter sp.]